MGRLHIGGSLGRQDMENRPFPVALLAWSGLGERAAWDSEITGCM